MLNYIKKICILFSVAFLLFSKLSIADNMKSEPFILNANKIINKDKESLVIAEGNVEIVQGNEVLRADYLEFNKKTNKAVA